MVVGKKRICVIGAGASGLPAIRNALDYGCEVVCYEAQDTISGLWRYKPDETEHSSVMKSTVINTSKELTSYSDFPPPAEMANYMHNRHMVVYHEMYAQQHGLMPHIKFAHKVMNVARADDYDSTGRWTVVCKTPDNLMHVEVFDGVLVCTGHHAKEYRPPMWPGQAQFKGRITHAHSYKTSHPFEDKTVVIIGVGNSGIDIAVETSRCAKQVYLSTRRGCWVLHRVDWAGSMFDGNLNNRLFHNMKRVVPECIMEPILQAKINFNWDHEAYGMKPKHGLFATHPSVNDDLANRIANGTVRVRKNISRFTETGVVFEDGTVVERVDEVVLATGYSFEFDAVEDGKLIRVDDNKVDLYQYMFPPETADHNTLAVIGLVQPVGCLSPIAEMQSRVFMESITGGLELPGPQNMRRLIAAKQDEMRRRYVDSRRHTIQVDYIPYMDELAGLIDCRPRMWRALFTDPALWWKLAFGPNAAYVYRLWGPKPWTGAREAIMSLQDRVKTGLRADYRPAPSGVSYRTLFLLFAALMAVLRWSAVRNALNTMAEAAGGAKTTFMQLLDAVRLVAMPHFPINDE